MKAASLVLAAILLCGCVTTTKLNSLSLGMTKAEVIATMGQPARTSATDGTEFLIYQLTDANWQVQNYFVRLANNRVDAFGREGDFNTTIPTSIRVISE